MSVAVAFHRLAADDYVTARRWNARRSRVAESRFAAVQDAVAVIAANPAGGSPSAVAPVRWVRVKRFPFTLYFRPLDPY